MNYFSLGEIVTDLAPEAEKKNLRNSEGAFLRLGNGNLIFVYSRFRCFAWRTGISDCFIWYGKTSRI